MRTLYGKEWIAQLRASTQNIFTLMRHGYAVVFQDCRGTFASEGVFVPHEDDSADGADTVSWLVAQDWCNGSVGSWGPSYLGFVQWQTAATGVPGLKAIAPGITSGDLYRAPWHSPGGALSLDCLLGWSTMMCVNEA